MKAILTLVLSLIVSTTVFAGHRKAQKKRTPIADAVLLQKVLEIETEIEGFGHKQRALRSSYRILLYTTFIANNGFCPVAIFEDPTDEDILDVLATIKIGVAQNIQGVRQAKKIHRKLARVVHKLKKRRVVDTPDLAELVIGDGSEVSFGDVPIFTNVRETLVVTNSGTQPAVINSVTLTGIDFSTVNSGTTCAAGVTVAVGQSCTVELSLTPINAGAISESITLEYDNGQATVTTSTALIANGI